MLSQMVMEVKLEFGRMALLILREILVLKAAHLREMEGWLKLGEKNN